MSSAEITPAKPLRADARRNRQRILDAAKEVFAAKGEEAQMDDIAREARVGVGTVYRHFPNKDVLMGELVKEKLAGFSERVNAALKEDDAWEAFTAMLTENAEHMAENLALQDTLRGAGAAWDYAEETRMELERNTDKLIRKAQRQGKMRKDFRARDVSMLMGGLCASMATSPAGSDWRRHLQILLDGLRAGD